MPIRNPHSKRRFSSMFQLLIASGAWPILSLLIPLHQADAAEPKQPVELGTRRELFVDSLLIGELAGTQLKMHEPLPGGMAIKIDKVWEGPANGPQVIFQIDGKYHLYYRGMTLKKSDQSGRLCVALSDDGVHWTKPDLGIVEYEGTKATNIIGDESGKELMLTPWLDTRPGVPKEERIKAYRSEALSGEEHTAFADPRGPKRLGMYVSADGFRFRRLDPQPEVISKLPNSFDGGNTMFWSEAEQQYVLYYRVWNEGRAIARMTSPDLNKWSEPVVMGYGTAPREQLYTNQTQPYFRAPHIYLALAARFMEGRRAITPEEASAIGLLQAQGHHFDKDCSDAVLLSTRPFDKEYSRTFMEAFVHPGLGNSNWVSRTNYPLTGILPNGPNEIMFFVSRNYMQSTWHIERLVLRTDGFASVNAPWRGGEFKTVPVTFEGDQLELNYRTSAAGNVRVEIQNSAGEPLPGFSAADCEEIIGDEISHLVRWNSSSDLSILAGKPVVLRFVMKDADLYSLQFQVKTSSK